MSKPEATAIDLPSECPKCNGFLIPRGILVTNWPYVHTDLQINCSCCKFTALHGVPLDKFAGLGLLIFDRNPISVLTQIGNVETPTCPFHSVKMVMTKIFGDKVLANQIRIQFKCPKCFLVNHVNVNRK